MYICIYIYIYIYIYVYCSIVVTFNPLLTLGSILNKNYCLLQMNDEVKKVFSLSAAHGFIPKC